MNCDRMENGEKHKKMLLSMNANLTILSSLTVSSFVFVHANIMGRVSFKEINNNCPVAFLLMLVAFFDLAKRRVSHIAVSWTIASVLFWIDIVLYKGLYTIKNDEMCQEYMMKDEREGICSGPS